MGVPKAKKPRKAETVPTRTSAASQTCFVISPFGGWHDRYYAEIFKDAVLAANLDPKRADDLYRPSAIVHDIWEFVRSSKVMLADLTGKNPNVFYELGLAHALGKPVVLVTQSIDDVPFDLRALRVITYDIEEPAWSQVLADKITKALGEVLAAPETAVLPTFLHEKRVEGQPKATPEEKRYRAIEQQLDLLRAEVRSSVRPRATVIPAEEARQRIRRYVISGMPADDIVEALRPLGPPESWTRRQIEEILRVPSPPAVSTTVMSPESSSPDHPR